MTIRVRREGLANEICREIGVGRSGRDRRVLTKREMMLLLSWIRLFKTQMKNLEDRIALLETRPDGK